MSLKFGDVLRRGRLAEFGDLLMLDAGKLAEDGDILHLARRKCFGGEPKHLYVRAAGGDPTEQQADSEYNRSRAAHWLSSSYSKPILSACQGYMGEDQVASLSLLPLLMTTPHVIVGSSLPPACFERASTQITLQQFLQHGCAPRHARQRGGLAGELERGGGGFGDGEPGLRLNLVRGLPPRSEPRGCTHARHSRRQ